MTTLELKPPRLDRREMRAQQVISLVLMAAERTFPYDVITKRQMRAFADELLRQFIENGVEVLTDWHREQMDMPARGPDGWTMAEIIAFDEYLLAIQTRPIVACFTEEQAKGLREEYEKTSGGITWIAPTTQGEIK